MTLVNDAEAERATLRGAFDPPELVPAPHGIDGALARIFAGCKNRHWSFYDESKRYRSKLSSIS